MTIQVSKGRMGQVGEIRFSKPPYNYACPELLGSIAEPNVKKRLRPSDVSECPMASKNT